MSGPLARLGLRYWLKLWSVDAVSLARSALPAPHRADVRILVYHDLVDVQPAQDPLRLTVPPRVFGRQIEHLHDAGFQFLSLEDAARCLVSGDVPHRSVVVTFDDGYASFLSDGVPVLQRHQVPATVFVAVAHVGEPRFRFNGEWPFTRPMTWDELGEASAVPGVDIGSHTMTHRRLHTLGLAARREELRRSREILETFLGRPVRTFSYPFGGWGTFPTEVQKEVEAAGYTAACAKVMGSNTDPVNRFALRRVRVGWEDDGWRFRLKVAGAYDWSDAVRQSLVATPPGRVVPAR